MYVWQVNHDFVNIALNISNDENLKNFQTTKFFVKHKKTFV